MLRLPEDEGGRAEQVAVLRGRERTDAGPDVPAEGPLPQPVPLVLIDPRLGQLEPVRRRPVAEDLDRRALLADQPDLDVVVVRVQRHPPREERRLAELLAVERGLEGADRQQGERRRGLRVVARTIDDEDEVLVLYARLDVRVDERGSGPAVDDGARGLAVSGPPDDLDADAV